MFKIRNDVQFSFTEIVSVFFRYENYLQKNNAANQCNAQGSGESNSSFCGIIAVLSSDKKVKVNQWTSFTYSTHVTYLSDFTGVKDLQQELQQTVNSLQSLLYLREAKQNKV